MWKTSSLSSTMTIPAARRITSTVSDGRPAVPTRALPTPSSPRGTCGRPGTSSECWRRPGRPSTPNCCSSSTRVAEAAVAECVTVTPAPTTPTSCTRMSVTVACAPVAVKITGAVTTATAEMETARRPPTGTEPATAGTATTQSSIRVTAAVAAAAPVGITVLEDSPAGVGQAAAAVFTISLTSHRVRLVRVLLLLHPLRCRSR